VLLLVANIPIILPEPPAEKRIPKNSETIFQRIVSEKTFFKNAAAHLTKGKICDLNIKPVEKIY